MSASADRDRLVLSGPPGAITPALRASLARHKTEILRRLSGRADGALSFAQERLWLLEQLERGTSAYHLPVALTLDGRLDVAVLERCLAEIQRRHEILRTTFPAVDGRPVPRVAPPAPPALPLVEIPGASGAEREGEAWRLAREEVLRPFDLASGPLLRSLLLRLSAERHVLVVTLHHMVADGQSVAVLAREISALYAAGVEGRPSPLPELPLQYGAFARWQRGALHGEGPLAQLAYWRGQLAGLTPLELPGDRPRPATPSHRGGMESVVLDRSLADRLRALAREEAATPFMVLLAGFKVLLRRWAAEEDVAVGTPIANRGRPEAEALIGPFVNTLVLRTDLGGRPRFRELVGRVRRVALEAYANQDVPFERLLEDLEPQRDVRRSPLFQVFFNMVNYRVEPMELPGLALGLLDLEAEFAKFDLSVYVFDVAGDLGLTFNYSLDRFEPRTARRMLAAYKAVLERAAAEPDRPIATLVDPPRPRSRPAAREASAPETTLPSRFAAVVDRQPERPAVRSGRRDLTYGELAAASASIARAVRGHGPGRPGRVALLFDQGAGMVAGMLGVLEAGGTYVPLDPRYPRERLSFTVDDADVDCVLADQANAALARELAGPRRRLAVAEEALSRGGDADVVPVRPDDVAYLLYTSGSTGRPKGVVQSHRNVARQADNYARVLSLSREDRLTLLASYGHDAAVVDVFGALLHGAGLLPYDLATAGLGGLEAWLVQSRPTVYHSTPTVFRAFLRGRSGSGPLGAIRAVVLGGEAAGPSDVALFRAHFPSAAAFVNGLGATESTFHLMHVVDSDAQVDERALPVGEPLEGVEIVLLDESGRPTDLRGEIAVRGDALALGYWRRPDLTAAAFVPDPEGDGGRLYRTGDIGRLRADGRYVFEGRRDLQVKVRGVRVELGEVEAALAAHPSVRIAAATLWEPAPGEAAIAGYYVPREPPGPTTAEVGRYLRDVLPPAMVPAALVRLDALPLTPTRKVDRRALPPPAPGEDLSGFVPPRSPLEEDLAAIFGDVLDVERVGVHDSFFDLGGHSLRATQLVSRIRDVFGVELPLRRVFESPTLGALAGEVAAARAAPGTARATAIPRLPRPETGEARFPASFAQQRLWFIDQLEPGSPAYVLSGGLRMQGELDENALRGALERIVARHEALRTRFAVEDGQLLQVVSPEAVVPFEAGDLRGEPRPEARLGDLAREEAERPFDLSRGPLIRVRLLRVADDAHALLLSLHHIVADGWSVGVLVRELAAHYRDLRESRPSTVPEPTVQYGDFAAWQHEHVSGARLESQLDWWRERLGNEPPVLDLPHDRPRPAVAGWRGRGLPFSIPAETVESLRELCRARSVTPFMALLAAFAALLARHSGQDDVVIGSPVANRHRGEIEGLIGFFVNALALRVDLSGDPTFAELLGRVREVALGAYDHQDLPFERLVDALALPRDAGRNPVFQVAFVLQNAPREALELPGLSLLPLPREVATTRFDLELHMQETGGGLAAAIVYNTDLFEAETVGRMAGQYQRLLESALAAPDEPLSGLSLLSAAAEEEVLALSRGVPASYPREGTIGEAFAAQVECGPEAVAVVAGERRLTYLELEKRSNRLAGYLRRRGVVAGDRVGVCMERSAELVVAVLGIVKAGAAYVPLEPGYPAERLRFMEEDSRPTLIVTQSEFEEVVSGGSVPVVALDREAEAIAREASGLVESGACAEDLAYVTYTSGSTGVPKGVEVRHRGVLRLVLGTDYVKLGPADVVALASSPSFDAITFELWGALLCGARVVVLDQQTVLSPRELGLAIERHGVTTLFLTTALFNQVVALAPEALGRARQVLFGGEAVDVGSARRSLASGPPGRLLHVYGPTENTTFSTWHEVAAVPPEARTVPIGRPIASTDAFVLDGALGLVPMGVAGELYLGGDGLARGYLNRPELTAERFVPHPYGRAGERLYRTGDRVRWLAGGRLEFLGRLDDQVKIRGFRIEPGEVEAALRRQDGVAQVAVVVREDDGEKRLVAYLVASGGAVEEPRLRARLRETLPGYMVPAAFVVLDALPITANGKVDRRALAALGESDRVPAGAALLRTPIEEAVAEVWCDVLGVTAVGADEDFFAIGGHSLNATQVVSRLRRALGTELAVRDLFEEPTVAGLARRVKSRRAKAPPPPPPIVPGRGAGPTPLSFAQQRLWFLDQLGAGAAYNIPLALRLRGVLDVPALRASLDAIVARHQALRTSFEPAAGQPLQVIHAAVPVPFEETDLRLLPEQRREPEAGRRTVADAERAFDLARGPLLRATLLRLAEEDWVLQLTLHHIVADGWSAGVLFRELTAHYRARLAGVTPAVPELRVQYADFAQWQREWLSGEVLEGQLAYWRRQLSGELPRLEMPTDRPRPAVQGFRGARHDFELPPTLAGGLRALGRREGATLFMTLLAGYATLLSRCAAQTDVIVGSPIANRNREETEDLVGFFVNSLALRIDLAGDPSFRELIARVREVTLSAYDHQDLPFERLVEELQPQRRLDRNPIFQVVFALQNAVGRDRLELPRLEVTPFVREGTLTRFDLEAHVFDLGESLAVSFVYSADLFEEASVARLSSHYRALLAAVVAQPEARLSTLPLLDRANEHELEGLSAGPAREHARRPAHAAFAEQAARRPDAIAVAAADERLSYGELDRRANQVARLLRSRGVGPDVVVGVCLERSAALVVSALAALKAGGAYLPMDPDYPPERLAFMIRDSGVPVLLTTERIRKRLPELPAAVVCLDRDRDLIEAEAAGGLDVPVEERNLAYVIYTSGSTGRPKGVLLEHAGLMNLVGWHCATYAPGPEDRTTLLASPGFDASVWELWPALAAGASLHVPDEQTRLLPARLRAWLAEQGITQAFLPTPLAEALLAEPGLERLGLRVLLTGGDRLHRPPERLPFRLVNHYGPTESTVVATCADVAPAGPGDPPIGVAIDNTQAWVLDTAQRPVPPGIAGELFVGGEGLARGYLGRPALTADRFVPNPFGAPGSRLYRTGDVVRRGPGGALEFLGRNDEQVKLHGHRIELGEIEATLAAHPEVQQAVVTARQDEGGPARLVAYVVPRRASRPSAEREQQHVSQWQMLYDETYAQGRAPDAGFDTTGWNSSYTGQPLPPAEMSEWVEATCERILARRPRRLLEIGCGTGLLLARVAPACERYLATDFSETALRRVREGLLSRPALAHVEVERRLADEFAGLEPGAFDVVVLNSVVQYFPSGAYLQRVLAGAVRAVAPGGCVFVGDVRSLRLLEAYHASVQLHRSPATLPAVALRQRVRRSLAEEEELVVDPAFFTALPRQLPQVGRVEIQPKSGCARNELNAFRYDAVLEVGPEAPAAAPLEWRDWDAAGLDGPGLEALLRESGPRLLGLRRVPNAHVAREEALVARLRNGFSGTVGELRAELDGCVGGITPGELESVARRLGCAVRVSWLSGGEGGRFDAVLGPDAGGLVRVAMPPPLRADGGEPELVNEPLRGRALIDLGSRLRSVLEQALPEAMLPSAYVVMDALPVTPNGKVDRRALPRPEGAGTSALVARAAPRSPIEEAIEKIFREVLGCERLGVHDDFFELGGHSLLATQVISRVRGVFRAELPLRALFEAPTVAALAERLQAAGGEESAPPLRRVARDGGLPLSFAQERLWFLDQLHPGSSAYNMPFGIRVSGPLEAEALAWSFSEILRRHEALRTSFLAVDGRPRQQVAAPAPTELPVSDLSRLPPADQEAALRRLARERIRRPFDLARGPLLRLDLVRLGPQEHVLVMVLHHVIADGWSMGVLFHELGELYRARVSGEPAALPELPIQYPDFAAWQRERLTGPRLEHLVDYWRGRLDGAPALELPTDGPRPPEHSYDGASHSFELPAALVGRLAELSRREGVTTFMTLLAAFQVLLSRYSGQHDVVVGSPIAGRDRAEIEGLVGFFVNYLVLRTDLSGRPSFAELLGRVREATLGAYAHQELPFEKLVEELRPERHLDRNPLFQVSVAVQNTPFEPLRLEGLTLAPLSLGGDSTRFDLALNAWESATGMHCVLTYRRDLFEAATIARMAGHLVQVLEAVARGFAGSVDELELLTPPERSRMLVEWNTTAADHGGPPTLHELFEAQVERTPEAVAVEIEDARLSYRELDRRANQLAHRLRGLGVGPETRVGVLVERSLELPVALLGILKAGAAWVPLDPSHPGERLRFMLEHVRAPLVLTLERLEARLPVSGCTRLRIDDDQPLLARCPGERPPGAVGAAQLAYVMYTSGSTGQPKGVMVPHRAILNHLNWMQRRFPLGPGDRLLQKTTLGFDTSVWECFAPLIAGACLVLARPEGQKDTAYMVEAIQRHRITVMKFVPSLLRVLLEEPGLEACRSLRLVFCGGEALPMESARRFAAVLPGAELHNLYGPTEAAVDVTWSPAPPRPEPGLVPIGRPFENTRLYVLDAAQRPVPVGVAGELYVGGDSLARGYLGRPDLTAERFVPDPFGTRSGERLYRTGDRVRYLEDGSVEFLGRNDQQVKVRGFRIELGEVESALGALPGVKECVVVAREEAPGDARLVAYLVATATGAPSAARLRSGLEQRLPAYMVPAAFVFLEALPRTTSGKPDRRALPAPERSRESTGQAFAAPRTEVERILAETWAAVLGLEEVGIHDNFFALGGDSILSIRVVSRARQAGLSLGPIEVFRHQTIAELAGACGSGPVPAEQGTIAGPLPLTPIQRRFFEREPLDPHHYNQSFLLEPRRRLDPDRLEEALARLVEHHDALRLRFRASAEGWQPEIAATAAVRLVRVDLASLQGEGRRAALAEATAEAQASLELDRPPLLRAVLFDFGPDSPGRLLLLVHHLAIDGVSWRVLLEDLETVYAALEQGSGPDLPPKTTSYRTWAERLAGYARSAELRDEAEYWLRELEGGSGELPRDARDGENSVASVSRHAVSLDAETTGLLLREVLPAVHAEVNDVLLAALALGLARWTGRPATLVDVEGHGREELLGGLDVSRTVGWFTGVFPVRLDAGEESGAADALERVREHLRRIPRRGFGYGPLRYLGEDGVARRLRAVHRVETSFNYLGRMDEALGEKAFLRLAPEPAGPWRSPRGRRPYLLEVSVVLLRGALHASFLFSEAVHRPATIEALATTFREALEELARGGPRAGGRRAASLPPAQELEQAMGEVEFT